MLKVTSDTSGWDQLKKNMEELSAKTEGTLADTITPEFVAAHSKYADFDELLAEVGITTAEEFLAFPDEEFDAFIAANTDFESWLDMQTQGAAAYMKAKLLKGLE